jgi:hypothetical protein
VSCNLKPSHQCASQISPISNSKTATSWIVLFYWPHYAYILKIPFCLPYQILKLQWMENKRLVLPIASCLLVQVTEYGINIFWKFFMNLAFILLAFHSKLSWYVCRLGRWDVVLGRGREFSLLYSIQTSFGAHTTSCRPLGTVDSFLGGRRGEALSVWLWPLTSTFCWGQEWWSYTSTSHIVWCLIKHGGNFSSSFLLLLSKPSRSSTEVSKLPCIEVSDIY